jgi:hypothetical protein
VRTLAWQPDANGQKVMLLLALPKAPGGTAPGSTAPGGTGRRGLFEIGLGGDPVRAWSIQEQGLLGGQP